MSQEDTNAHQTHYTPYHTVPTLDGNASSKFSSDTAGDSGAPLVPEVFPGLCQHKEGSITLCPARRRQCPYHPTALLVWFEWHITLTNTDCHPHGPEISSEVKDALYLQI